MEISRPYNNEIVVIKDIISKEENEILRLAAVDIWMLVAESLSESQLSIVSKIEKAIHSVMVQEYKYMTNPFFRPMLSTGYNHPFVVRGEGDYMEEHFDGAPNRGPDEQPLNLGSIYYITDDFEGGETFYPELGYGYKPLARSAIIHPGEPKFLHRVNKVGGGLRITMVTFAFNDFDDVLFVGREGIEDNLGV